MKDHLGQVLKAGGLVPAGAKLGKDEAVDTVVARAYEHPVLPGRKVVRLTAQSVAAGDDLEMSVLGFGKPEDRGAVGKERKRPLGFPGWCLVHDPKNARYALDVVGELKKHARKAKSKPGHAKDGIDAIAEKLGKTVPHFLPSFYEEAGRAFIEHGAQSYAATMFAKAREAEAVHALDVDEQHRIVAFLEFALAGAVTTKALTEYAKQLAEHHAPKDAYAHFRQLCVQRTLGGMPPWAGMAKDLRRLAKAAKLDPDSEDGKLVEEIVQSPALAKAAGEFWRAYTQPITELGKRSPAVRGALLNLFPTGTTYNAELDDIWLDLLESTGAVQALVSDDAPEDARPSNGRAAWFDKLCQHLCRSWRDGGISTRAFALLRRMAPMLAKDGAPISCMGRWQLDLDLAELALELGLAVKSQAHNRIDLDRWAAHAGEPERGRDPVRVAAHPELGKTLGESVSQYLGHDAFDVASRGKPGFLAAKRGWLAGQLARAETKGLPACDEVLDVIAKKVRAETFAELPELHARLAALDVAPVLARSLRVGILDEFGWPALEAAGLELDRDGKTALSMHGGLPAVIVASATRAIAVGPRGRLGVHDLVIPPKHELVSMRFIGGQFLVLLKEGWTARAYWSSAPHDLFAVEANTYAATPIAQRACVAADGAWIEGKKPLRVGDRAWIDGAIASNDGTTSWVFEWKDGKQSQREVSASGEPGRFSFPAFLDAGLEAEWWIDGHASYVLPAPAQLDASPLGITDGKLGLRVRYRGKPADVTAREVTRIDGKTWSGPMEVRPYELLTLPTGETRPLVIATAWRQGATVTIVDESGTHAGSKIGGGDRRYLRGSVGAYPQSLWHALVPRDLAGSQRLRAVTDQDARAMIDALAGKTFEQLADLVPSEIVQRVLPEIADARLRAGVAGLVALAAQLQVTRDKLRDTRAPGAAPARREAIAGPTDDQIKAAIGGWVETQWAAGGVASKQIAEIGEHFASSERGDRIVLRDTMSGVVWQALALVPGALAFFARGLGLDDAQRKTLRDLRALIAGALPEPTKLRLWHGQRTVNDRDDKAELAAQLALRWHAGNAYAITKYGWHGNHYRVLEFAPDGQFKPLPHFSVAGAQRGLADGTHDVAWQLADAPRLAELTGMTPSEATFLLAGCPKANDRSANFLPKELREQLGLKAAQAAVARDSLNAIPLGKRLAALAQAGDTVESLAASWNKYVGKRIAIPEELVADADRELQANMEPSVALAMIGSAAEAPELNRDVAWGFDATTARVIAVASPAPLVGQKPIGVDGVFTPALLQTLCSYLPFLYAELPVGHPLRAQAVRAYELANARLANPHLLFDLGEHLVPDATRDAIDSLVASLGGEEIAGLHEQYRARIVPGAIVLRRAWTYGTPPITSVHLGVKLRPATLDGKALASLDKVVANAPRNGWSPWRWLEVFRGDDFAQMMKRIEATPVPVGGWEQNPLASAAKTVERAAKKLGVSKEAAAVYLQYLVLLWPTGKNLAAWNGWKPKQVEAANAELVAKELVMEAKRERAQRTLFLPGGWEALKSPNPPFESWKLPMYGSRDAEGNVQPTLVRFLALAPFHLLFERAWARIESGDVPKYEEVKR